MNAIQKATGEKVMTTGKKPSMQQYIKQMEGEIKKALPSVITPERFTRIVLSALSTTPALAATTPQSFLGAMMTAAQLGMEPNTCLLYTSDVYKRQFVSKESAFFPFLCRLTLEYLTSSVGLQPRSSLI